MRRYSKRAVQLAKESIMHWTEKVISNIVRKFLLCLRPLQARIQTTTSDKRRWRSSPSQPSFLATADHSTDEDPIDSELSIEESSCHESSSESNSGLNHIVEADTVDSSRSAFSTLRWKENAGTLKRPYGLWIEFKSDDGNISAISRAQTLKLQQSSTDSVSFNPPKTIVKNKLTTSRPRNDQDDGQGTGKTTCTKEPWDVAEFKAGSSMSRDWDETCYVLTIIIFQATMKRRQTKSKLTRNRLR